MMNRIIILILILMASELVFGEGISNDTNKNVINPSDIEFLITNLSQTLDDHRVPGASIALVTKDNLVWSGGIGLADIKQSKAATASTIFRVNLISKSFVALAFLKLQEQGMLNLNDKLKDIAPEITFQNKWEATQPLRIKHLLNMTSGFDELHLKAYQVNENNKSIYNAVMHADKFRLTRWPPGTQSVYNNGNYAIVAYLIDFSLLQSNFNIAIMK